ncbi:MAG: glycosyltransferase family 39 protein [Bacteroidales bacterium]|nr:glycosyltransferase family 39 protein [Bacteroidales bacterium]
MRSYKLNILTTYSHDQGIDFHTVREALINQNFPLIGIKISFAEFFQGPIYLYILMPFFLVLDYQPIAGPIAAIFISTMSILLLCYLLDQLSGIKAAIIGTTLFAVSPQFIKFGNTPLYQHFLVPFILILFYVLYKIVNFNHKQPKNYYLLIITSGIFTGICMEIHLLAATLMITSLIIVILDKGGWFKKSLAYVIGVFTGILPTVIFEFRHNFLNTRHLISYLESASSYPLPLRDKILTTLTGAGNIFGGQHITIGTLILLLISYSLFIKNRKQSKGELFIHNLTLIQLAISLFIIIFINNLGWWYLLPFWLAALIQLSSFFSKYFDKVIVKILLTTLIGINLTTSIIQINQNHGYYMPEGWNMNKINKVAEIISNDTTGWKGNFNVLSLLGDDTRAYSIRYSVEKLGKIPGKVTDYNQNNSVYIVHFGKATVIKPELWELKEFSPYQLNQTWDLENNIYLSRLDKIIN